MSKRDIERALRKKGVTAASIEYVRSPTPGEMVPTWIIELSDDDADKYGEAQSVFFDTSEQALEWIDQLEPYTEEPAHDQA